MNHTANLILGWNPKSQITMQMPFEEWVLQYIYAKQYDPPVLCHMVKEIRISDLATITRPCVKPVSRNVEDPLRQYLANMSF